MESQTSTSQTKSPHKRGKYKDKNGNSCNLQSKSKPWFFERLDKIKNFFAKLIKKRKDWNSSNWEWQKKRHKGFCINTEGYQELLW